MTDKTATGRHGEDLALDYLESKGYRVLRRNYRYRRAEIDLIVRKDNLLVFVEVKARRSRDYGEPETFVNKAKVARILEAADHYLFENNWHHNIRFDIVAVSLGKETHIDHFEDAFY